MPTPVSLTISATCEPGDAPRCWRSEGLVQFDIGGLEGELAAAGHRVPRVDGQVHEDLLELARVGLHAPERRILDGQELDVLADQPPEHLLHVCDHRIEVQHLGWRICCRLKASSWWVRVRGALAGRVDQLDCRARVSLRA